MRESRSFSAKKKYSDYHFSAYVCLHRKVDLGKPIFAHWKALSMVGSMDLHNCLSIIYVYSKKLAQFVLSGLVFIIHTYEFVTFRGSVCSSARVCTFNGCIPGKTPVYAKCSFTYSFCKYSKSFLFHLEVSSTGATTEVCCSSDATIFIPGGFFYWYDHWGLLHRATTDRLNCHWLQLRLQEFLFYFCFLWCLCI